MQNSQNKKKLFTFLGLLVLFSGVFYYLIISAGSLQAQGGLYVLGLMWSPGLAGMITQLTYEHTLKGLGWKIGKAKYLLIAYLLPFAYCIIVYGITWISKMGTFPNAEFAQQLQASYTPEANSPTLAILIFFAVAATVGLPLGILSGLGEEIGWRGFFVPELYKRFSYRNTMLISGGIWALWHMPLILFADYSLSGAPTWYAVIMFVIMVMGITFAFGWLRLKSGSLWPAAVLHASHNLFIQTIFTPLTGQNAITPYIIDEFGIGLAIMGILVAILFLRKKDQLPTPIVSINR